MAAIRNALNIHALRPSLAKLTFKSSIPIPIPTPIPIETYFKNKPSSSSYVEMVEIPPPYCTICHRFLTTPLCKEKIQPLLCPLNGFKK